MFSAFSRSIFVALLVLYASTTMLAADAWLRIETDNFELVGNAAESDVRAVAERMERFREAVGKIFAIRPNAVKTRVIVFKDDASFRPFKPKKVDGTPDDLVAGLFQPGEDVNYIAVSAGGSDLSTIYHEYTHDIVNASYGRAQIPTWLNEGLAEYFQTFRIVDDRTAELGVAPRTHLIRLRSGPLISWDEFFGVDNHSLQEKTAHFRTLFYAQAWAVVRFLMQEAEKGALKPLGDSRDSKGFVEPRMLQTFATELGRTKLDAGIRAIISSDAIGSRKIDLVGAPPSYDAEAQSVPKVRADTYLGDFLYHLKDYSAAESYLKASLAADPKSPEANAALGMVRLRQRRFAEARRHLESAVASDTENFLVHFYYAYLLTREKMNEAGMVASFTPETAEKIRGSLRRSIALNGQFAESYRLLAFTALVTNDELDEALTSLKKAESLRPGDAEIGLMIPQLLLRQEKGNEALLAAEFVHKTTADRRTRKEAEALMRTAKELTQGANDGKIALVGNRRPVIYQRKDLTDEQYARIELDRAINNINLLIERPGRGERQSVGRLGRVSCVDDRIVYSFKSRTGELKLTGGRFDDLRLKVLIEGTRSFSFRCDLPVTDGLTVITYRSPAKPTPGYDGELLSVAFVPAFFELRTLEEAATAPQIIIQGGPMTLLEDNEKIAAVERAEMERVMRETEIRDIEERLRPLGDGEHRLVATPEKLECTAGRMVLTAVGDQGAVTFRAPISDAFEVVSFNLDTGVVEVGCRSELPPLPAVITYRIKNGERELLEVAFVPRYFKLSK